MRENDEGEARTGRVNREGRRLRERERGGERSAGEEREREGASNSKKKRGRLNWCKKINNVRKGPGLINDEQIRG